MTVEIDRLTTELAALLHRADEFERDARGLAAEFVTMEHRQRSLRTAIQLFVGELELLADPKIRTTEGKPE